MEAMGDPAFWHNLQDEFTKLIPAGNLSLDWLYTTGMPGHCQFTLVYEILRGENLRLRFEVLARRAGAELNHLGDEDSLRVWFDELTRRDKDPRNRGPLIGPEMLENGTRIFHFPGRIPDVCVASANCCIELEISEMEAEQRARLGRGSSKTSPKVADTVTRSTSANSAKDFGVMTVARLLGELNILKLQMVEDESEYTHLRAQYPDFLTFRIAEQHSDLKTKILALRSSARPKH
jgi:hypothetical protein